MPMLKIIEKQKKIDEKCKILDVAFPCALPS